VHDHGSSLAGWTEQVVAGSVTCNEGGLPMTDTGSRRRVRAHRERLRAQGLRPVQIWVPDVNAEGFAAEAHRQSRAVAASEISDDDQAFVDSISEWPEQ
jgi:hypothetical protein